MYYIIKFIFIKWHKTILVINLLHILIERKINSNVFLVGRTLNA